MFNKIAFVCVNPWEKFLPCYSQGNVKDYYEWLCRKALLLEINPHCRERIETYGDFTNHKDDKLFLEDSDIIQFLYVQSKQKKLLEEVFKIADLVLVGMPCCRKECDKIFLSVLPWKEKSVFLWNSRISRGEDFFRKIQREYKLKDAQMIEVKKLPSL